MVHALQPLETGDHLLAITPSGPVTDPTSFQQGLKIWQERGYHIDLADNHLEHYGYLAGSDKSRQTQLQEGLNNDKYKGIICIRGGYGSARLLENFEWTHGKWLIGFSDVTSLLWSMAAHDIKGAVHGPTLSSLADDPAWSIDRLFDIIEGRTPQILQGNTLVPGEATGKLLPANLTTATHLIGTKHFPDWQNIILALEDYDESIYRIDRQLTQWRVAGLFERVVGIVLGRFSECEPHKGKESLEIEDVLKDRLGDLGIPILTDLPFGHCGPNAALPVGVEVTIKSGQLLF